MTDSSIGIQTVTPLTGTSQGRNETSRDQNAKAAALESAQRQQDDEREQQSTSASESTRLVDITV